MTHRTPPWLFAILLGAVCALACRSSPGLELASTSESAKSTGGLVMEAIRTERRGGRLHVSFDLRNRDAEPLAVTWTLRWLDAKGDLLPTGVSWRTDTLEPSAALPVSRVAPSALAAGFKLDFQPTDTPR